MSESEDDGELGGSELGTKDYWDTAYVSELKNYENHGDVGEVWFGEESALRVIRWMCNSDKVKEDQDVIDLGCGNGMMLIELAREGFSNLTGVDYSKAAIDLAEAVAAKQELPINYLVCNLLTDGDSNPPLLSDGRFKVALDKGTYDAISLHPEEPHEKRLTYLSSVWRILSPNGLFILTSCNWTQSELETHMKELKTVRNIELKLVCEIPTPKFQFGGRSGSLVTTLVYEKR